MNFYRKCDIGNVTSDKAIYSSIITLVIMVIENSENEKSNACADNVAYDIICYYKEENEDDNDTVHAVIENIERTAQKQTTKRDKIDYNQKHVMWRLFGCLIIIILLSSPIYGWASLFIHQRSLFDENIVLIWAPIIYSSVYLLVTPWLFSAACVAQFSYRIIILASTFIMSLAISISGLIFVYFRANFLLITLLYGVIGGACACVIMGKVFVIINGILNNERLYLINFIYSFAQGVTQFALPILIHINIRWINFDCSSMLFIAALTLHISVITLLVVKKEKVSIQLLGNDGEEKLKTFPIDLMGKKEVESRCSSTTGGISDGVISTKTSSYDFYPSDVLLSMDNMNWKNPSTFNNNDDDEDDDDEVNKMGEKNDHFLEILDSHRVLNSDGVEILETIAEIDEEEIKFGTSEDMALENKKIALSISKQEAREARAAKNDNSVLYFLIHPFKAAFSTIQRQIINPLRRSLMIFKFYPSVILKSVDVFSYLLFITFILPNQAIKQLRFKEHENVIYLITLMGFSWCLYSIVVLKFHKALKQNFIHYFHLIGLLAKIFGYLFTNQRYSLNGFLFGIILISIGHANCLHLQETVIRNCFHPRKWHYIRGSIYSFSGFLILVYCVIFHIFHLYFTFVTFANIFILFNLISLLIWLFSNFDMVIMMCNMR